MLKRSSSHHTNEYHDQNRGKEPDFNKSSTYYMSGILPAKLWPKYLIHSLEFMMHYKCLQKFQHRKIMFPKKYFVEHAKIGSHTMATGYYGKSNETTSVHVMLAASKTAQNFNPFFSFRAPMSQINHQHDCQDQICSQHHVALKYSDGVTYYIKAVLADTNFQVQYTYV